MGEIALCRHAICAPQAPLAGIAATDRATPETAVIKMPARAIAVGPKPGATATVHAATLTPPPLRKAADRPRARPLRQETGVNPPFPAKEIAANGIRNPTVRSAAESASAPPVTETRLVVRFLMEQGSRQADRSAQFRQPPIIPGDLLQVCPAIIHSG